MRIAILGFSVETMIASPVPTEANAIETYSPDRILGDDLWMIRGVLQRIAEDRDVEPVPLFWATALPGGLVSAAAYAEILSQCCKALAEQGPFDGVVIVNHGALEVDGLGRDADTDFVSAARQTVGPDLPIALALDLHGDMTPELLDSVTVLSVLRTAPHRDDRQTGYRAADQLIRVIRTGIAPKKAAVRIPMLIPGEVAVTQHEPAKSLYGGLPAIDARPGVIEANILVGFAWNDLPWTAATAIVISDGDAAVARDGALALAADIWAHRSGFTLKMDTDSIEAGLQRAGAMQTGPVFLTDSGDNTTAGAAGDLTLVLQAALDCGIADDVVVAGITAPETVRRLIDAGPGATIGIVLGVEHVSRPVTARAVDAVVEACGETLELPGFQPYRASEGAWARVRIGAVVATFHSRAIGITTPAHFAAMGIDPLAHKICIVKLGYLHPQLEDIAAHHILLLSDGPSQLDMTRLRWSRLERPAFPLDPGMTWSPEAGLYASG